MPVFVAPSIHTRGNGGYKYDSEVIADTTLAAQRTRVAKPALLVVLSEILRRIHHRTTIVDLSSLQLEKELDGSWMPS